MKRFIPSICILLFTLSCAEEAVNPCKGVVCQNDGVCRNGECQCSPSYVGEFCQTLNTGTVTFVNNSQTPIAITANGTLSNIAKGGSLVVTDIIGDFVSFSAETSGKTSTGSQIGLKLTWTSSYEVTSTPRTVPLDVGSEFFFLKLKNTSSVNTLLGLYVNYLQANQTYDNNFSIAPGGAGAITYDIGYYRAFTNTTVRCYITSPPTTYYQWVYTTNFTFPFTNNQTITLTAL